MIPIPCPCPGTPHEGDTVTLREALPPRDAMAITKDIDWLRTTDPDATEGDVLAVLTEGYVMRGVEAWSLVDEDGKPLPVTKTAIRDRLLSDLQIATIVGDEADERYARAVMLPLLLRASRSSQPSPTTSTPEAASTSAPTDSGTTPPTPSTPTSTTTTPTDDTETAFSTLGGAFNGSLSSASAA